MSNCNKPTIAGMVCKECVLFGNKLASKENRSIRPKTPLAMATSSALIQEIKNCRSLLKEKEIQLQAIKKKIEQESVCLEDNVHVSLAFQKYIQYKICYCNSIFLYLNASLHVIIIAGRT